VQAALHRAGHIQLSPPELVGQRGARQHSPGGEEVMQRRERLGGDGSGRQVEGRGIFKSIRSAVVV
jgi:hypothetical protein